MSPEVVDNEQKMFDKTASFFQDDENPVKLLVMRALFIASLVVGLSSLAFGKDDILERQDADLFEEFVAYPPMISNLSWSFEIPSLSLTNFFCLRYQPNAIFFGRSQHSIQSGDDLDNYEKIVSSFENKYWYKYVTDLHAWTNRNAPDEKGNVVDWHYRDVMGVEIARLLNMGCWEAPVGSIDWGHDAFVVTNKVNETWVSGRISRDDLGKASSMAIEVRKLGETMKDSAQDSIIYDYLYDRRLSLAYLPSSISVRAGSVKSKKQVLPWSLRISDVQTGSSPLSENAFALIPYSGTGVTQTFYVSNRYLLFFDGLKWQRTLDKQHPNTRKKQEKLRYIYIAVGFLCLIPILIFWFNRGSVSRGTAGKSENRMMKGTHT